MSSYVLRCIRTAGNSAHLDFEDRIELATCCEDSHSTHRGDADDQLASVAVYTT
jgi:hypothetical protein